MWSVTKIQSAVAVGSTQNVIKEVKWQYVATNGESSIKIDGSTELDTTVTPDFIPFENLTEADVLSFVHSAMGADAVAYYENRASELLADFIAIDGDQGREYTAFFTVPENRPELPWAVGA